MKKLINGKWLLSLALVVILMLALMPLTGGTARADGASTGPGANGYVYFGTYGQNPVKWRVLDANHTNTNANGMFLITDEALGTGNYGGVVFSTNGSQSYQGSQAQAWCASLLNQNERAAVLPVTKSDGQYSIFSAASNILNGDRVFFLSAEEAEKYFPTDGARIANYNGSRAMWWLRSPSSISSDYVGVVFDGGNIGQYPFNSTCAARPALNIDPASVFFFSAAEGGKPSGSGANALTAYTAYAGDTWKMTLLDGNRSLNVGTVARSGNTLTVAYTTSGVYAFTTEYVSGIVRDSNGNIAYYGRLGSAKTSGSVSINLTDGIKAVLKAGGKLYLYSEQYNGDKKTDYASALREVSIPPRFTDSDGDGALEITSDGDWTDFVSEFDAYASSNMELTANIRVTGGVGSEAVPYTGTFDGNGHTITMNLSASGDNQGVFGRVVNGSIQNVSFSGTLSVAGAGSFIGPIGSANNSVISGVTSSVALNDKGVTTHHIGGIAGHVDGTSTVERCSFSGSVNVSASTDCIGGVVGYATQSTTINNCANYGSVTNQSNTVAFMGGILGYENTASVVVKNCLNIGTISPWSYARAGAIIGDAKQNNANSKNNYYLDTSCTKISSENTVGGMAMTAEEMQSGYVARLLNGGDGVTELASGAWGQNVGTGNYPVLGGPAVNATLQSAPRTYLEASVDSNHRVSYTAKTVMATNVTANDTAWSAGGWYIVNEDITLTNRVSVNGEVHLILGDGKTLTASQGIQLANPSKLFIYGQSAGTGRLIARGSSAGIGGGGTHGQGGTLVIHGGIIEATGGSSAAGIGGGANSTHDAITIYGGTVTATGGADAAGIGGGSSNRGGYVVIYGGSVTAIGGSTTANSGAGIGGGYRGMGGDVAIYGGTVTATAGKNIAKGIGRGSSGTNDGSLTVGPGVVVYGGNSPDPTAVMTNFNNRPQYMKIVPGTPHNVTADGTVSVTMNDLAITQAFKGETVTITAAAVAGKEFHEWQVTAGTDAISVTPDATDPMKATFTMPDGDVTVTASYLITTISTEEDWNSFAAAVNSGVSYSGKTVSLGANITIHTPVGTINNRFSGTFDGQNHTLTLDLSADTENCAPFNFADGATFQNLNLAGTVTTSAKFGASLAGFTYGSTTIQNCHSTVTITGTITGDGTHAGFVAVNQGNAVLTISNCSFKGSLLGGTASNNGGFVGWNTPGNATISYNNCLFAPVQVTMSASNSATFNRNGNNTLTNAYYTQAYGTAEGVQVYANTDDVPNYAEYGAVEVTAADGLTYYIPKPLFSVNVTSAANGTVTADKASAIAGDTVALTVTPDAGYALNGLTVTYLNGETQESVALTETETGYTFPMPAADVTVTAAFIRVYTITDDGAVQASYFDWDAEDVLYPTEAPAGLTLSLQIRDGAMPQAGYYFTGEFTLNGESLGWQEGDYAPMSDFTMPAANVAIGAVQAPQETLTLNFAESQTMALPDDAYMQLQDMEGEQSISLYDEETWDEYLDVNRDGTGDLLVNSPEFGDDNTSAPMWPLTIASGCSAVGTFNFSFTGAADHYSAISFVLGANPSFSDKHSLTLDGGQVGVNFYVLPGSTDPGAITVKLSQAKADDTAVPREAALTGTPTENGYKVSFTVNAKEMTDKITATLWVNGEATEITDTYSVRDYRTVAQANGDAKTKAIVDALLTYGGAAQRYFDYRTDRPADAGINSSLSAVPEHLPDNSGTVPEGLTVTNCTVMCETTNAIRVYFNVAVGHDVGEYQFSADGQAVTPTESTNSYGQYYLTVAGIQPQDMDVQYPFTLGKGATVRTMKISVLDYAYAMQSTSNSALGDVVKAMYLYYQAAENYQYQ